MVTLSPAYLPSDGGTQAASAAPSVEENWVVQPSLTLLVLLLVPCVLLLFFLNCFLLFHRLPAFSLRKRASRRKVGQYPCVRVGHSGQARLEPPYMLSPGVVLREGRLGSDTISQGFEATLALEEGVCGRQNTPQSRGSCCQGGSIPSDQICCSPRPRCATPLPCCAPRRAWNAPAYVKKRLRPKVWKVREDELGSSCELDTRHNHVPPNTPAADNALGVTPKVKFCHTSSTQRKSHVGMVPFTLGGSELLEDPSVIPREDTAEHLDASSSLPGPGLDSDFGESPFTSCPPTVTLVPSPGPLEWNGIIMTHVTCGGTD
ncbi:protein huluwa isoform X2 [Xenopus laevis]|uniref:Protein huluwa isoform X2 n=1 Tax=Xenopus laevis TaxID=8355 RepID=A0A8J0VNP9_XENLA|nr:protein huluwa isoform X2 [Xenopus laevis]